MSGGDLVAREAARGTAERPRRDADQRSSDRAFTASDLHVSPMPGRSGTRVRPSWICSGSSRIASAQSTYSRYWKPLAQRTGDREVLLEIGMAEPLLHGDEPASDQLLGFIRDGSGDMRPSPLEL
jgi:hypothetical protein